MKRKTVLFLSIILIFTGCLSQKQTEGLNYAPQNVKAISQDGRAVLMWEKSGKADGYNVYMRKDDAGIEYEKLVSLKSDSNMYMVDGLTNGKKYYLAVAAIVNGVEKTLSREAVVIPSEKLVTPVINEIKSFVSGGAIYVSWNHDIFAAGYTLYEKYNDSYIERYDFSYDIVQATESAIVQGKIEEIGNKIFVVRAYNNAGESLDSREIYFNAETVASDSLKKTEKTKESTEEDNAKEETKGGKDKEEKTFEKIEPPVIMESEFTGNTVKVIFSGTGKIENYNAYLKNGESKERMNITKKEINGLWEAEIGVTENGVYGIIIIPVIDGTESEFIAEKPVAVKFPEPEKPKISAVYSGDSLVFNSKNRYEVETEIIIYKEKDDVYEKLGIFDRKGCYFKSDESDKVGEYRFLASNKYGISGFSEIFEIKKGDEIKPPAGISYSRKADEIRVTIQPVKKAEKYNIFSYEKGEYNLIGEIKASHENVFSFKKENKALMNIAVNAERNSIGSDYSGMLEIK